MRVIESILFLFSELILIFLAYSWYRKDAEDRIKAVFKTYLSWTGYCVLSFFALEYFGLVNNPSVYLALNLFFSALFLVNFHRAGKVNFLFRVRRSKFPKSINTQKANHKFFIIAYSWIGSLYFVTLLSNFASSPTVDDELTSYLVRVEHWVRAGFIQDFDVYPYHSPLNIYPIAFQSILLKLRLISGSDLTYQFLTFASITITALAIYKISIQLTKSSFMSHLGVIVFLSSPFVLQAAGMNLVDVFTASLIILFVYFLLFEKSVRFNEKLFFGLLAISIAIAAKQSTIFFLPGFVLLLFLAFNQGNKIKISHKWLAALVVFMLISAPIYLRNYFLYGHVLGNPEAFSFYTGEDSEGIKERLYLLRYNLTRFVYFFFLGDAPEAIKEHFLVPLFDRFGSLNGNITIDLHYLGVSYFGFLVVPTFLIVGLVLFIKASSSSTFKVDPLNNQFGRILLVVGISLPILLFLISRTFTHAFSRYLFPVFTLFIPLAVAGLHSISLRTVRRGIIKALAILLTLWFFALSTPIVSSSGLKPLLGNENVFHLSRVEESVLWIRTLQGEKNAQEIRTIYQFVNGKSDSNTTLCLDIRKKFSAYPFLYKKSYKEVNWINLDTAKRFGDKTSSIFDCNVLLSDSSEFDVQLTQLYENRRYFELNQLYVYSQLKTTES